MSTETLYQAAIANMFLGEITCHNITIALRHFNKTIDPRITGWELYRNGRLAYTYDRVHDRVVPFDRSPKAGRVLVEV